MGNFQLKNFDWRCYFCNSDLGEFQFNCNPQHSCRYFSGPSTRKCTWNNHEVYKQLWSLKLDHIFKRNIHSYFRNVVILGVKFNASLRLDRWQIVFVGSRSSSSPIFEILFHLFLRFTFLLNLFKGKTLWKTVLDFVLFFSCFRDLHVLWKV